MKNIKIDNNGIVKVDAKKDFDKIVIGFNKILPIINNLFDGAYHISNYDTKNKLNITIDYMDKYNFEIKFSKLKKYVKV